jgi:signal transduction histidine kinase
MAMWTKTRAFFSTPEMANEDVSRQAMILNFLLNISIGITVFFILLMALDGNWRYVALSLPPLVIFLFTRVLLILRKVRAASLVFIFVYSANMITAYLSNRSGALTNPDFTVQSIVLIVSTGLLLGWQAGVGYSVFITVLSVFLAYLEKTGYLVTHANPDPYLNLFSFLLHIIETGGMIGLADFLMKKSIKQARDELTQRRRAEEQVTQLNLELECRVAERTAELEAANKELEAFSYSVSHDLHAPLRAINGFAKILDEDFSGELSPASAGFLRKIRASGEKMAQLIEGLLDFSRLGRKPLTRQNVAPSRLVENTIESLVPDTANRQIEWELGELPLATADPTLLQQVYANLIGNAIKYTRKRDSARIEVGSLQQDGQTVYFVRDNGAGFDMRYAEKLFGVFQRLHRPEDFEGTGIGLATVQRIIQRHGGRIWADAEVDKGATFFFTLG